MTIGRLIDELRKMADKHGEETLVTMLTSFYDSDYGRDWFTDDPMRLRYINDTVQIVCDEYDTYHSD